LTTTTVTTSSTTTTTTTTTTVTLPPTTSTPTTASTTTSTTAAPTCANGGISCGAPCGPAGAGVCYGTQGACNAAAALLCTASDPPKCLGGTDGYQCFTDAG